jgi:4-aminobutyrate aminotransferase-like enzyme
MHRECERLGIWYIDDEVQVGLGRTGRMFAIEHDGVKVSKGAVGE